MLVHLNPAQSFSCLKITSNRFDDSNLRICFAIYNHLMLKLFRSSYVEEMFLRESVVPTTVPGGEPIRIPLPGSGKRGTGQRLYVNVPFGIGICSEVDLPRTSELATARVSLQAPAFSLFRHSSRQAACMKL